MATKKRWKREERGRGTITRTGENKWQVRVYRGLDGAGKRMYSAKTIRGTFKQADQERTRMLSEMDRGTFVAPAKETLREYLTGYRTETEEAAQRERDTKAGNGKGWLNTTARLRVAPKTLCGYRDAMRLYTLPVLGQRRLDAIQPADVQGIYSGMISRGLSPRSVQMTHTVLKSAFKQAVRWRKLAFNPCEAVDLPKQVRNEMKWLPGEQTQTLLESATAKADELAPLWNVLLLTGMRPGEARGLKWSDFTGSQLCIQRAIVETEKGAFTFGEPKTKGSRRTIDLPQSTVTALNTHRKQQAAHILASGKRYKRLDLIFANNVGKPLDQSMMAKRWADALTAAKLPSVRLYDARHSHASILLAEGVHPKVVSERLGHASITMTLATYSHVLPRAGKDTAAKLDEVMNRKVG